MDRLLLRVAWVVMVGVGALPLLPAAPARADVPFMMPMQGVLRDNAGMPVAEGTFAVTFSLYGTEAGGAPVWTESWPPSGSCADVPEQCLAVKGGAFHVLLGSHSPLDPAVFAQAPSLWLGMTVESDPELPRRRIGATAYALRAASADVAGGLACSGCVGSDQLDAASLNGAVGDYLAAAGYEPGPSVSEQDVLALLDAEGYQKSTDPILPSQLPQEVLAGAGPFSDTFQARFTLAPSSPDNVIKGFNYQPDLWTKTLPSLGAATALSVSVDLQHTDASELVIRLVPPPGMGGPVVLHDQGLAGVSHLVATWTDQDALPLGSLADLLGKDPAGTWTLSIFDGTAPPADDGTLLSWSIEVTYASPDTLSLTKTVVLDHPVVDSFTCAEDIDASAGPLAVWYDGASGGVRVAAASDWAAASRVVGVATVQPRVEAGDRITVQTFGVVDGFAGLTPGAPCYLAGGGGVSPAVGAVNKLLGTAVGPTKMLLQPRQPELEARRVVRASPGIQSTELTGANASAEKDFTIEVECGFVPRSFEADVHQGIVWGASWSYNQNAWMSQSSYRLEGDVGGGFVGIGTTWGPQALPPNSTYIPSPYGYVGGQNTVVKAPGTIAGQTSSPGLTNNAYSNTSSLRLQSITASGTKLVFTFRYLPKGSSSTYGIRYGVTVLTVHG